MLDALVQALVNIFTPLNLILLMAAVFAGLILGAIPGLGGITGLTLLLPFVFTLPPETSMVLLIGLSAVVNTGDTIPAVLFGIPGTVGAQATIMDGFPMAKRGEAGRAFGAAFTSSALGGLFGALLLLAVLPILRPLVLSMGSPEFMMMAVLGVSMISTLTTEAPLIGLALGLLGIITSMIGQDPDTGMYRWMFDQVYLLGGIPIIPAVLGLFGIPDLLDLVGQGKSIAGSGEMANIGRDLMQGIKDTFRHWWLVLRCSLIGAYVGAVPGLGSDAAAWMAYGHVKQTVRDPEMLGKGDVRGVLGPEAANNAKVGGALIPTMAFGVPGSLAMVILLGAFTMAGLVPGPDMITKNLHVTMTIVWTLAIANVIGALICIFMARQIAKLCFVRIQYLAPLVLVAVFIAAVQATAHIGDLIVLLAFAAVGWFMKSAGWPRPPLILGMVLGPIIGKYLFISARAFGYSWMWRPGVLVITAIMVISVALSLRGALARPVGGGGGQ